MPSTPIKSCNKYVLSYKDSFNNKHDVCFYTCDAYKYQLLQSEFKSNLHNLRSSAIKNRTKNFEVINHEF